MSEQRFHYMVAVEADTLEQADLVIAERLDHEEEYGFNYLIWSMSDEEIEELSA